MQSTELTVNVNKHNRIVSEAYILAAAGGGSGAKLVTVVLVVNGAVVSGAAPHRVSLAELRILTCAAIALRAAPAYTAPRCSSLQCHHIYPLFTVK